MLSWWSLQDVARNELEEKGRELNKKDREFEDLQKVRDRVLDLGISWLWVCMEHNCIQCDNGALWCFVNQLK